MTLKHWNEKYQPLYSRSLQVLLGAGLDPQQADSIATERVLSAALAAAQEEVQAARHAQHQFQLRNVRAAWGFDVVSI